MRCPGGTYRPGMSRVQLMGGSVCTLSKGGAGGRKRYHSLIPITSKLLVLKFYIYLYTPH